MYYADIELINGDIELTIEKLYEVCPGIKWKTTYNEHDLGGYYSIVVNDEVDDFDEDYVEEIVKLFNSGNYDEIMEL